MDRGQLDACRDERGFIDISCLKDEKSSVVFASNAKLLYELDDCQVIFKSYSSEQNKLFMGAFNEVLYFRLAKKHGIFCAEYDFATLGDENGTVSYIIKGNVKSIYELSRKKYSSLDVIRGAHLSYLELCNLFEKRYKKHAITLKNELLNLLIFDALLGHSDKGCTNLLIYENENEVHLYSVDGSDLWGKFISLKNRGRELHSFLSSLDGNKKNELLDLLLRIDVNAEIDNLVKEYPVYTEIAKTVKENANRTREAILQGENNKIINDYFLYPKREIRIKKGGKII